MSQHSFDILIAGGGVVGCTAALAIANASSLNVGIVEAFEQNKIAENEATLHPSFDARVVALAKHSYQALNEFGIDLSAVNTCPIDSIHVSDRGHIGQVHLSEQSHDNDTSLGHATALGYVTALDDLGRQLNKQVSAHKQITLFCPEQITAITQHQNTIDCTTRSLNISAKLLLIAEGAHSSTKHLLGMKNDVQAYEQTAIIANVETQLPHNNRAFERFTSQGPLALLPMKSEQDNRLSMVWTVDDEQVDSLLALNKHAFLSRLQMLFSDKLGRFVDCTASVSYPLNLVTAKDFTHHRVLCLGNAAQSLHPIAGQGFNLGVRDVQALLRSLSDLLTNAGEDAATSSDFSPHTNASDPSYIGSFTHLQYYKQLQSSDKRAVVKATDGLVRLFSNQHLPLVLGRNLGLLTLNNVDSLKQEFTRAAMGARS